MFSKTHQTGTTYCPPCFYELHSRWGMVLNLFHSTRTAGSQLCSPRYITNITSKKVLIFNTVISPTSVGRNPIIIRTVKSDSERTTEHMAKYHQATQRMKGLKQRNVIIGCKLSQQAKLGLSLKVCV